MIPKIIHFCWLSNDPFPTDIQQCIDSWKRHMPDYEIKRWSTENFDIQSVPLVSEAFEARKYAFAADYIRCYALYHEGGIYLDSDVMLHKSLQPLLDHGSYITSVEYHPYGTRTYHQQVDQQGKRKAECPEVTGIGLQAAFMASVPGHPLMKQCMNFYQHIHLTDVLSQQLTAPTVQGKLAESLGFRYVNQIQHLDEDVVIYPKQNIGQKRSEVRGRYATHQCASGWVEKSFRRQAIEWCNQIGIYPLYLRIKDALGLIR